MSSLRLPRLVVALLAAVVLVAGACSSDPPAVVVSGSDPATAPKDIIDTLEAEGFTVLLALLEEAGLTDTLRQEDGEETFTLFAPTDDAFASLAPGVAEVLSGEDEVVAPAPEPGDVGDDEGTVPDDEATEDEADDETTDDETTDDETTDDETTDDETTEDQTADETADDEGADDETAQDAASAADQATPTTLAERPSRDEIRSLLGDILENHVVEGTEMSTALEDGTTLTSLEGSQIEIRSLQEEPSTDDGDPTEVLMANGAEISDVDLVATNGVIHTIGDVLVPADRADALDQVAASIPVTTDVLSTLTNTGEHGELLAAIDRAGLTADLSDAADLTLFAPTDAAFGGLTPDQRAALDDTEVLAELLLHHAVSRTVRVADVRATEVVQTMAGDDVRMEVDGDTVLVDDARVEDSIDTTSGVVHVVDGILVPDAATGPGGF